MLLKDEIKVYEMYVMFWSHFIKRGESLYTPRLTSHAVNQVYLLQM